jgi:hypothetical protein
VRRVAGDTLERYIPAYVSDAPSGRCWDTLSLLQLETAVVCSGRWCWLPGVAGVLKYADRDRYGNDLLDPGAIFNRESGCVRMRHCKVVLLLLLLLLSVSRWRGLRGAPLVISFMAK